MDLNGDTDAYGRSSNVYRRRRDDCRAASRSTANRQELVQKLRPTGRRSASLASSENGLTRHFDLEGLCNAPDDTPCSEGLPRISLIVIERLGEVRL